MTTHKFYPPVDLPSSVQTYVHGLKTHKADYGDVTANAPNDLKDIEADAKKLEPLAQEIDDLELQLASKREAYYKRARPLWDAFTKKLGYARTFAEKHDKDALKNFLRSFNHHAVNHQAAKAAADAASATSTPTTNE